MTVKPTWSAPAGTDTVAGTVAEPEFDDKLIVSPPVGAGPLRVNVPADEAGPTTDVGFKVIVAKDGGVIVSVADSITDPTDPDITA